MTTVLGLTKLQRKLDRLPSVAKAKIRAGIEEAANEIVAMMKSLVAFEDGILRDSIGWTWGKAPKGSTIVAAVKGKLAGDMTVTIYAGSVEAYYARWVEFGTAAHVNGGKFAGTKHPGASAQPFFYVSWRASKKSAKAKIRKANRDAAKQVAAG